LSDPNLKPNLKPAGDPNLSVLIQTLNTNLVILNPTPRTLNPKPHPILSGARTVEGFQEHAPESQDRLSGMRR